MVKIMEISATQQESFLNKNMSNITYDIGYNVSNKYVGCLAISIASILSSSLKNELFNFYVLHSDISEDNKRKINKLKKIKKFNIEYIQMNNKDFKDIANGVSVVSNYRIKISSIKPNLNKILFLDSDIIITESLSKLWNTDLKDNYIAACVDPGIKMQYDYTIKYKELFPDRRFNTGLMLINLKKWRDDNIEQKLIDGMIWYSTIYDMWPDQNVMNMIFNNKILELSPIYNVCPILAQHGLYQDSTMKNIAFSNPKVIHFCGRPKYWEASGLNMSDIFWEYARLTPFYEDFMQEYTNIKTHSILNDYLRPFYALNYFKIYKLKLKRKIYKLLALKNPNRYNIKNEKINNKLMYYKLVK